MTYTNQPTIGEQILSGFVGLVASGVQGARRDADAWAYTVDTYGLAMDTHDSATSLVEAMPDLVSCLAKLAGDALEHPRNRAIASLSLSYTLFPFDVLPQADGRLGLFGLLDDAIIAVWTLDALEDDLPKEANDLRERCARHLDQVYDGMSARLQKRLRRAFDGLTGEVLARWEQENN